MTTATVTETAAEIAPTAARRGPLSVLRAEVLKIRTTNTWWIFGIIALALTALSLLANLVQANGELSFAEQHHNDPMPDFGKPDPTGQNGMTAEDIKRNQDQYLASLDIPKILVRAAGNAFTSGQYFGLLLMVILGALIVTNEFFHQTATTTFLTTPRRTEVILGKLGAAVVLAGSFWLITTVIDLASGSLFFAGKGYSTPLADWSIIRSILMNLLAYVIWAVLGIGLGVLIRSQLGATITGAAFYLLSLPAAFAVFALLRQYVFKTDEVFSYIVAVPGVASMIMISPEPLDIAFGVASPAWWVGGLVLGAYGIVAGVVGTLITRKRDIS